MKKISSQEPDVTVIVGSGNHAREFSCYGIILASASPVLDSMLSSGMIESEKRIITFAEKDPDEWETILQCIDPASAILYELEDDELGYEPLEDELINYSNVKKLARRFNELQMSPYLRRCDYILYTMVEKIRDTTEIIELLIFSLKYNLEDTYRATSASTEKNLERFCWGDGDPEQFNFCSIKQFSELFLPMSIEEDGVSEEKQRCKRLWGQMSSCIDISLLSIDMINDLSAFSHILYYALQHYHKFMKAELDKVASKLIGQEGVWYLQSGGLEEIGEFRLANIGEMGRSVTMADIQKAMLQIGGCWGIRYGRDFDRRYELLNATKTLRLVCEPRKELELDEKRTSHLDHLSFPRFLRGEVKSSEPDMTVVVGRGSGAKEFRCHASILAFASAKLDSMVEKASGRLLLPQFDPDVWRLFLQCVDPYHNGDVLGGEFYETYDNFNILAPLFMEFEMTNHLICCREIFEHRFRGHSRINSRSVDDYDFKVMLVLLQYAVTCNLADFKERAEKVLKKWFDNARVILEQETIQGLVALCLPIQRNIPHGPFMSISCPILWQGISSGIQSHLKSLACDKVDESECSMFSHLIHSFFHIERMNRN